MDRWVYTFCIRTSLSWCPLSWSQTQRVPLCWGRSAALTHLCKHTFDYLDLFPISDETCPDCVNVSESVCYLKVLALLVVLLLLEVCWLLPRTLCRMDRLFFLSSSSASSSSVPLFFFSESQTHALFIRS